MMKKHIICKTQQGSCNDYKKKNADKFVAPGYSQVSTNNTS